MPDLRVVLKAKKDTQIITEKFRKREFVGETLEQYPQKIPFQCVNDRVSLLDNIQVGQEITVGFNFRGTEYAKEGEETKYFLNLEAWKIN